MKAQFYLLLALSLFCIATIGEWIREPLLPSTQYTAEYAEARLAKMQEPSEHFYVQRAYPDEALDLKGYEQALGIARRQYAGSQADASRSTTNKWTVQGPGNIGGRINVVEIHPTNNNIIYVGSTAGGIHKTTDGGLTWLPIFDDFTHLAIGEITLDPSNPDIVYAGTGDPNITGFPFIGDGVYKSLDGGQTWNYIGLEDQRIVSRIVVDPTDSLIVYVATMGLPFERNTDRGLYKSTDGGMTWTQSLFVSDQAGIIDLIMDPFDANVLYAASWDRIRTNQESLVSGPDAGIWKSTDKGLTWNLLSNGLPPSPQGRIGLTISQQTAGLLYALYVDTNSNVGGVFQSTNGGTGWTDVTGDIAPNVLGGFGWYFGQIRVNPQNDAELWVLGVDLWRSQNTGNNWFMVGPPWWTYDVHADKHDLQYTSNGDIYLTTDGGLYKSTNNGNTWTDIENIANTQFYRVAVNPFQPTTYYGGAQDNGSTGGDTSNFNSWPRIFGGDGFQMRFDPDNANIWYAETQRGGLRYSTDTGNSFSSHTQNIDDTDRRNWDMPFILSSFNPARQYTGTYRVYRNTTGAGGIWNPISPDLTDGVIFGNNFHTISTVEESSVDEDILYAGTSDGNVWVSSNLGLNWTNITDSLPDRYVTSIKASQVDDSTAFVTHSGYKYNDFFPHIHKTTDLGATWIDISGDLPPIAINDVYLYPNSDEIIFVATDGGVYGTQNGGLTWNRIGDNMPIIPVYDLEIEPTTQTLIAGTHARSIMTFNLGEFLLPAQPEISASSALEICEGDSIVLSTIASSGYLWSTGDTTQTITVSESGVFQVSTINSLGQVSDLSDSVVVTAYAVPPQPVVNGNNVLCDSDTIQLMAPAGFAYYNWSNGDQDTNMISVSAGGIYSVQLGDWPTCLSPTSDLFAITQEFSPVALFSTNLPVPGLSVEFSDSSSHAATYMWDFGDGTTSQAPNPTHTYFGYGDYTIQLIVSNDCGVDTFAISIALDFPNGIEENWTQAVRVFPIPANGQFQVEIEGIQTDALVLQLYDMQGKSVWKNQHTSTQSGSVQATISVEGLSSGIYMLQLSDGIHQTARRVLID